MKVTKDMIITEAIQILGPESGRIMMEHGLHCISCHVATMETLEQGMLAHGYDDEDVKLLMEDLNRIAKDNEKSK